MEYVLDIKSATKRKWLDALMPGIIKELGLERSQHVVLITTVPDCGDGNEGATIELPGIGGYIVTLTATNKRSLKDLTITLCHEMVHVKQMATGLLKSVKGGHTWAGKFYSAKKTKYLDMPWEIQAFSKQELILRRVITQ